MFKFYSTITTAAEPIANSIRVRSMREVVADLDSLLGELASSVTVGTDIERVAQLSDVRRAITRLQAVELRLVSAAQSAGVAKKTGHADISSWLAQTTQTDGREAAQVVRLAASLNRRLPLTQQALGEGSGSRERATVIDQISRQLPATLTPTERKRVESSLVAKAKTMNPQTLRRAGRRALAAVEPMRRQWMPTMIRSCGPRKTARGTSQAHVAGQR